MTIGRINVLILVFTVVSALQKPERHYGCPPGKNACIYPIDEATLQCETLFDFQVALHVPSNTTIQTNWRNEMNIKVTLPNGRVTVPEKFFKKSPELRRWTLQAFKDSADETPRGFDSYALVYRNVIFPKWVGGGNVVVTVIAGGVTTSVRYDLREPKRRRAKNVILFIGDGMSLPMTAAVRLVSRGMMHGKYKGKLNMESFPYFGLQNPSGVDSIITDSANSGSSMNTGQKTSVSALGVYADSGDDTFGHPKVETIAEHIKRKFGMSVGVVTTAEVQDATPASVWSHIRNRSEKAAITAQAINGCVSCIGIVRPDVLMGGGGKYFLPNDSIDGSNMYRNYSDIGYTVTHTRREMLAAARNPATRKLLTITHHGNMDVWLDRNVYTDNVNVSSNDPKGEGTAPIDQPNLDEMVMSAIEVLSKNSNGFYLEVEAASIDKSAHALDVPRLLSDLIELDNTVGKVADWAKENGDDTLILVTADHGHGFDVFGTVDTKIWDDAVNGSVDDTANFCSNVTDGNGKIFRSFSEKTTNQSIREANRARRSAIGIYGDAGYPDYVDSNGDGFPDSWEVRTTLAAGMNNFPDHTENYKVNTGGVKSPSFALLEQGTFVNNPTDDPDGIFLSGNLPLGQPGFLGVHTLQDVGVYGYGPGSDAVSGNMDNTEIYHIMANALGFGTNGEILRSNERMPNVVPCVHSGTKCHCYRARRRKRRYRCMCERGLKVYVAFDTLMCGINGWRLYPM